MMIGSNYALSMAGMTLTSVSVAMASRDNNLYQGGKSNPNLKKFPMYHAGSANVLESLDAGVFQALFIQYSGCV
jgi:hypothetical protein